MGENTEYSRSIISIINIIRHREPFIFVDSVLDFSDKSIDGFVIFSREKDRWCNNDSISGTSIVESFAQLAGLHIRLSHRSRQPGFLVGAENGYFPVPLHGPATVRLRCERLQVYGNQHIYRGNAQIGDREVGRCDVTVYLQPASVS